MLRTSCKFMQDACGIPQEVSVEFLFFIVVKIKITPTKLCFDIWLHIIIGKCRHKNTTVYPVFRNDTSLLRRHPLVRHILFLPHESAEAKGTFLTPACWGPKQAC